MTHASPLRDAQPLHRALGALVDAHGLRPVLVALVRAIFGTRPRALLDARTLSNHLRRDIGLGPNAASPPHWERTR